MVGREFISRSGGDLPSQLAFDEQQGVLLQGDVTTDTCVVSADSTVDSAFVALQSLTTNQRIQTSVTFDGPILGVVYISGSPNYAGTDFLGAPQTVYNESKPNCSHCGFDSRDRYYISGNTITFVNNYLKAGDYARVITAAPGCPPPRVNGAKARAGTPHVAC